MSPTPPAQDSFGVGKPALPLRVRRVGGGFVDLAGLRGHPIWVDFTATYCPPCRDEYPLMERFSVDLADKGLIVIGVHVRDDEALVADFAADLGVTFVLGLDTDGAVAKRWGALVPPVHFFVDASGVVRYGALGGLGPDTMIEGLRAILPGVTIRP